MLSRNAGVWNWNVPISFGFERGLSVDIGCGSTPRNPLRAEAVVGIDLSPTANFTETSSVQYRPTAPGDPLPFESGSVDVVTAYDFVEHLPRWASLDGRPRNLFIEFMSETWRVLKNDGLLIAVTPCYPRAEAFVDPTHVNYITPKTHGYFANLKAPSIYGFTGNFDVVAAGWLSTMSPLRSWDAFTEPAVPMSPVKRRLQHVYWKSRAAVAHPSTLRSAHFLWVLKKAVAPHSG